MAASDGRTACKSRRGWRVGLRSLVAVLTFSLGLLLVAVFGMSGCGMSSAQTTPITVIPILRIVSNNRCVTCNSRGRYDHLSLGCLMAVPRSL